MSHSINTNGRPVRKTLASQLDRLDGIIDSLAEGLNGAVADAVREAVTLAVQQAVEAVLREVLSRPELLRHLAGQTPPATTEPKPPPPSRLKKALCWVGTKAGNAWRWVCQKVGSACHWTGEKACCLAEKVKSAASTTRRNLMATARSFCVSAGNTFHAAWKFRGPVMLSLLLGAVAGCFGYLAGPIVSSAALGVSSSAVGLLSFLLAPFVRLWKCLQAQGA